MGWWRWRSGRRAKIRTVVSRSGDTVSLPGGTVAFGLGSNGAPGGGVSVSHSGDATVAGDHSIANAGYIHQILGENLTLVQHSSPREPAAWPHQVGYVPRRAQSFQHRVEAEQLRAVVDDGDTAVLTQVLNGMGGVGKTQLAADYAHAAWQDDSLDLLVWVTASNRTDIVARYAQAATELCRADPGDPDRAAEQFLAWLTPKATAKPCRWLIVLDDVVDPDDLIGLWPPDSPHGRTLVTTRCRDAALIGPGRRRVPVGLFSPAEALACLKNSLAAHRRTEPTEELAALAEDLGYLPLALSQSVAYLVDAGVAAADYRTLLADRGTRLKDIAPDRLPDDQLSPLAAVWSLSADRAAALGPAGLVRPMLQLAAALDPNGIPAGVLTGPPACAFLASASIKRRRWWRRRVREASDKDAMAALRALHRLHLVDHDHDAPRQPVRVHQLIQRVTYDETPPESRDAVAHAAADALVAAWPTTTRDAGFAQTLRANAQVLARHAGDTLFRPGPHRVLYRLGQSLGDSGQIRAATLYFQDLTNRTAHALGIKHRDTLLAWHCFARWRGQAGDPAGAAAEYADLLEHMLRVHGPDHPETLVTRSRVADWRGQAGDPAGAAAEYADLLEHMLRIHGPDHPDTLVTRSRVADWQGKAGDPAAAAAQYAELIEDMVRALGPDHSTTLVTRSILAGWQGKAGDPAAAVAGYAALLEHMVRALGPDHPDTLGVRKGFAYWLGEAGDASGAATAYADLLDFAVRVLGLDHSDTFIAHQFLVHWREKAGEPTGAAERNYLARMHVTTDPNAHVALLRDEVDFWMRVQGPVGPNSLTARNNLAFSLGQAGNPSAAAAEYSALIEDMGRTLGPEHPEVLSQRGQLAHWRGEAGDTAGAAAEYSDLIEDVVRTLGPDHPDILYHRGSLARCLAKAGDAAKAATAYEQLLHARRQHLGDNHPETLAAWGSFAHWQGRAGDTDAAAAECTCLLEHMKRVLGEDHHHLWVIQHNITHWETIAREEDEE
ncbi:tetratricopeptide repeat protein [Streptomyces iakyrus]|uniref:tetratricopeptide repeat protein n=1 Tax=Streptomyces iakyrus TaxID=68219 RepID=UPI003D8D2B51